MLKSMTGFGEASLITNKWTIVVEVASLNAKFFDLDLSLPAHFCAEEPTIRHRIRDKLQRGRVHVVVTYDSHTDGDTEKSYNRDAFVAAYTKLKKLADSVMAPYDQLFSLALHEPGVMCKKKRSTTDPDEWPQLEQCIVDALDQCDQFRITEGHALCKSLQMYIKTVRDQRDEIASIDVERMENMKSTMRARIADFLGGTLEMDQSRLERELLSHIEKTAIDEELMRLKSHLTLFDHVLDGPSSNGRKLGFIVQEIGREVNTIGAKANDIAVQQCVIVIKEELNKIKEQLNNVI